MNENQLQLEVADRPLPNQGRVSAKILVTPPIDPEYWYWRVRVSEEQAILGFPKFNTVGIGFAEEDEDWNTNLPFLCSAQSIYDHIKRNKGSDSISESRCLEAIEMLREAARQFKGLTDAEWKAEQARMER